VTVSFDTNILLDVLANRTPFVDVSQKLWELSELNEIHGVISILSFNNIFYIVRKASNEIVARECLRKLRDVFQPIEIDSKILHQAMDSQIKNFEDAIQYFSSIRAKASHLVTRNPVDYPSDPILPVVSPEIFLNIWNSQFGVQPSKKIET